MKTKLVILSFFIWLTVWAFIVSTSLMLFFLFENNIGVFFLIIAFLSGIGGLFWMPVFIKLIEDFLQSKFKP